MAIGSQRAMSGEGRLAWGKAIRHTPAMPQHSPKRRTGLNRSMPSAKAMGSDSMGTLAITIDITPLGKCATAR